MQEYLCALPECCSIFSCTRFHTLVFLLLIRIPKSQNNSSCHVDTTTTTNLTKYKMAWGKNPSKRPKRFIIFNTGIWQAGRKLQLHCASLMEHNPADEFTVQRVTATQAQDAPGATHTCVCVLCHLLHPSLEKMSHRVGAPGRRTCPPSPYASPRPSTLCCLRARSQGSYDIVLLFVCSSGIPIRRRLALRRCPSLVARCERSRGACPWVCWGTLA